MSLPGYDEWKTHNPSDDCCDYCGADPRYCRGGWEPNECTGECGLRDSGGPDDSAYRREMQEAGRGHLLR